jgi:hypothetical protein
VFDTHWEIEGERFIRKKHPYNLPIGLLRIANKLLLEGDEICFLDCQASLPACFLNSKDRITLSNDVRRDRERDAGRRRNG